MVPVHKGFGEAVAERPVTGALTTTADDTAAAEQVPLDAVSVYTPALPATTPVTPVLKEPGDAIVVPPGPTHEYIDAPLAVPVRTKLSPTHIGFGLAVALTPEGTGDTVTMAVLDLVVPQPFVAAIVYTPAFAAITPATPVLNDVGLVIAVPPGPDQR